MRKLITAAIAAQVLLAGCRPKVEPAPPAATTTTAADSVSAPPPAAGPRDSAVTVAPRPIGVTPPQPSKPTPTAGKPKPVVATKPAPKPPAATSPAPAADAPLHDQWHPAPRDTLDGDTYQGWKQFELNCSRCHGEYAVGTSFAPALVVSLKEGGTIPTKELFMTTVCAGRLDKGMPSWCALGLEMGKIEQIYMYVKGRADGHIAAGRPAQRE
jgi:mono/diheme cytochrome c family protein